MVCSIVQVQQRFIREGCPNCESFLGLQNHPDSVQECTSQVFEGLITLADPAKSWVARWQRLEGYVSGVYAVKVVGQVSRCLLSEERCPRLARPWSPVTDLSTTASYPKRLCKASKMPAADTFRKSL